MSTNRAVIEKEFLVLEADKKNKNHRAYPKQIIQRWIDDARLSNGGYDVEFATDDNDFEYEFLKDDRVCGNVFELRLDGNKLIAKARFKIDGPYADAIYGTKDKESIIDKISITPKGKGAVKNQLIQDDFELYGFNLIFSSDSPFIEDVAVVAEASSR